jgi:hypothetical protein
VSASQVCQRISSVTKVWMVRAARLLAGGVQVTVMSMNVP